MLLAILFGYLGYKRAVDSGRNGIAWAAIAVGVFIGLQLLTGLGIGIIIGIGSISLGWSESLIDDYEMLINIFAIGAGLIGGMIVLWYLGRVPRVQDNTDAPPPPPKFDGS